MAVADFSDLRVGVNADPAAGLGLTRPEAAHRLKTSVETLRHWESIGYGPRVIRLSPRKVFYPEHEIEAFIASCTKGGAK